MHSDTLVLGDGRTLAWTEVGDPSAADVLVHYHGTGSSRLELDVLNSELTGLGLKVILFDRPGYGLSSPLGATSPIRPGSRPSRPS